MIFLQTEKEDDTIPGTLKEKLLKDSKKHCN